MTSFVKKWWRAARPYAFPASIIPACTGIAVAYAQHLPIDLGVAMLTLVGAVAAHTAANLINDYRDFALGCDRPGTLGGCGLLVSGELQPQAVLMGVLFFTGIAGAIALYLSLLKGFWFLGFCVGGVIVGGGYALPPLNLKYRALGDIAVFVAFGIGITLGSYLLQAGRFSWAPLVASTPLGFFIIAILHANNMRDLQDDLVSGFRTMAARLQDRGARAFFAFLMLAPYVVVVAAVFMRILPTPVLLIFVTLPAAVRLMWSVCRFPHPPTEVLMRAVPGSARLCLEAGMSQIAGLVLSRFFSS